MHARNLYRTVKSAASLPSLLLLTACLLWLPAMAQEENANAASQEQAEAKDGQVKIRPFNTYERFSYEAGISNQLQNMMSRYLKPNLFAISVQIEGRMISGATPVMSSGNTGGSPGKVKGRPNENSGEDKTIEMLPALPFFSSRLRAPVEVENPEVKEPSKTPGAVGGTALVTGPQIDKIKVVFVLDTAIKAESAEFYKSLITSTLRLNAARGDEILLSNAAFPRSDDTDATASEPFVVNAQIAPNKDQNEDLKGFIAQLTRDLTLQILVALAILGVLIFIGLVWRGRNKSELSLKGRDARNLGQELNPGGGGLSEQAMANMANMMGGGGMMNMTGGTMRMQTEMVLTQDSQQMELNQSDPLMNWLVNDKENLSFVFERWLREMGPSGVHKIILLLYPYGHSFFEMICEQMAAESVDQLEAAWLSWKPNDNDPGSRQRTMDELVLAMRNQRQFGHFPFIIHLKDREIVDLIKDEEPLECLMVLNGLNSTRKSNLLNMLGTEKTALVLASFTDMSEKRFGDYADLSARLFTKLKEIRERSQRNEKAYEQVLATIEQQNMTQQEEMVENLRDSNEEMYRFIRERITLWSDVAKMPESVLRDAMTGLDSEALAAIVAKDEALEQRLLPLRPAREQALVRDLIAQGAYSNEDTEMERKKFLLLCRQLNALLEKTS